MVNNFIKKLCKTNRDPNFNLIDFAVPIINILVPFKGFPSQKYDHKYFFTCIFDFINNGVYWRRYKGTKEFPINGRYLNQIHHQYIKHHVYEEINRQLLNKYLLTGKEKKLKYQLIDTSFITNKKGIHKSSNKTKENIIDTDIINDIDVVDIDNIDFVDDIDIIDDMDTISIDDIDLINTDDIIEIDNIDTDNIDIVDDIDVTDIDNIDIIDDTDTISIDNINLVTVDDIVKIDNIDIIEIDNIDFDDDMGKYNIIFDINGNNDMIIEDIHENINETTTIDTIVHENKKEYKDTKLNVEFNTNQHIQCNSNKLTKNNSNQRNKNNSTQHSNGNSNQSSDNNSEQRNKNNSAQHSNEDSKQSNNNKSNQRNKNNSNENSNQSANNNIKTNINNKTHDNDNIIKFNRYNGRKRYLKLSMLADSYGTPLGCTIIRGNEHDTLTIKETIDSVPVNLNTMNNSRHNQYKQFLLADSGYSSLDNVNYLKQLGYTPIIAYNQRNTKNEEIINANQFTDKELEIYENRKTIESSFAWFKNYPVIEQNYQIILWFGINSSIYGNIKKNEKFSTIDEKFLNIRFIFIIITPIFSSKFISCSFPTI